ncbi:hypothetical protein ASD64_16150 [Mesorhizobium sp. Root157]|uniref:hypothetical protein n=1 Tax=Mesorhizobium sp. Root157 TaxID=1736477 RepID=UPI0006F6FABE|nr:hypothetical protein [Mesorhizobium sp. Root157]KQZ98498.1 hypothetical protein ASD64_16150 [Mesorhizobium sp. Root157]
MTIHRSTFQKLAFSTFLFSLSLNSALAQDTAAVADRLKSVLANQGIEINWAGVSGDTSSMVLEGVIVKPVAEKDGLEIGDVTLEGVSESNGSFVVDTVSTKAFSKTEGGTTVDVSPVVMHGVTLGTEGSTDPMASLLIYKSAEIASLTVKVADKTAFSMENMSVDVTPPADGQAMAFTGSAEEFTVDLSLVEDPKSREVIDALGYQTISGSMGLAGSWQPSDGRMELSQYDITVDDAGTFGMTFDLSGYTLDFFKSMQEMQKKIAEQPEGADKSAQGMAMLGLMQQLSFSGASIRFEDDSLTNRLLEYFGKQQGMSAKDIANQAKAIVPFGLAQLNNPELTAQASAAVNQYLDDPKSIVISARPASPVPFALIMADAMSNPLNLTKTLGVAVKANDN